MRSLPKQSKMSGSCAKVEYKMTPSQVVIRSAVSLFGLLLILVVNGEVFAANDQKALAKAAQNPLASMISLPFQSNTNFGYGPEDKTQETLNIQPVWPFELSDDLNLVTRTILPVVSVPALNPDDSRTTGWGDTTFTGWFSPSEVTD